MGKRIAAVVTALVIAAGVVGVSATTTEPQPQQLAGTKWLGFTR